MYIKVCFDELKNLKPKYKTFAVLGNYDQWEGREETIVNMKDANIEDIDNNAESIKIGEERIKIVGVGDYFEDEQNIDLTTKDVGKKDFVILVSNNPDYIENIIGKK